MTGALRGDVIVIGAGIAGASVAAHLAQSMSVILLERERLPGRHSTGRSAALFSEVYGGSVVRALSQASRALLFDPPGVFGDGTLTSPRGFLWIASEGRLEALKAFAAQPEVASVTTPLAAAEALARCPILKPEAVCAALVEEGARDVDVDLLHQGYLRMLRSLGGQVITDCHVAALVRGGDTWRAWSSTDSFEAPVVVNAAGAWADQIASIAGVRPVGLQPMRRTAVLVDAPVDGHFRAWPLVMDIDEQCYFKPESGRLLLSPADETPSPPCDAQPEQLDIAIAIDRVQQIAHLDVKRVVRSWAGLRSFVADRAPVAGFDPEAPGFFWLAGQGGYGIQTAPALGRAAAALLQHEPLPTDLAALGLTKAMLAPERLTCREATQMSRG